MSQCLRKVERVCLPQYFCRKMAEISEKSLTLHPTNRQTDVSNTSACEIVSKKTILLSSGQGEIPDRRYSPQAPFGAEPLQLRYRQLQSG